MVCVPNHSTCPAADGLGGFAQEAKVAFATGGFGGVVEGVVLAGGELVHEAFLESIRKAGVLARKPSKNTGFFDFPDRLLVCAR